MKKILFFLLFILSTLAFAQNIKIVQLKSGGIFIESESDSGLGQIMNYKSTKSYYAGPSGKKALINGFQKAIEWANLNEQHNKEFEKEITRLRVMNKDTYIFYKEFISEFSEEGLLNFYGYENGRFMVELEFRSSSTNIKFNDLDDLKSFKRILEGKSANTEIDNIFK